jgi:AcrR family transcriptional regulator
VPEDVYNVNMAGARSSESKDHYHHGNLAAALIDAGLRLAGAGGPSAVTVRAAAREVGVSAPAAYRHFEDRDGFLKAVARRCRELLAQHMIDARSEDLTPLDRFRAVGGAYINFAASNPQLADCAFACGPDVVPDYPDAFAVLVEELDELTDCGVLRADRREGAEIVAWSSVHGMSMLLAKSPDDQKVTPAMIDRVLLGVFHSLMAPDP